MNQRNVYLNMKPLKEARRILTDAFPGFGIRPPETVSAPEAVGRVLAAPVFAAVSSPNFHIAAMDGIAVSAADTCGASETSPKSLEIGATAYWVNTGRLLPEGTDAVIMVEHITIMSGQAGSERISIEAPAFPWQYVRKMGEDMVATELIFSRNHLVTPYCLGALLGGGVFDVPVRRKPRVFILPTGNELTDWRTDPADAARPGRVAESNSWVLAAMVAACGGEPVRRDIVPDRQDDIRAAVDAAAREADMVLTVGGSSAGSEDFTRAVFAGLGDILFHGVAMMPGKPLLAARIHGIPSFGMPGYPVSMIVAFEQLVRPLIFRMLGREAPEVVTAPVRPVRSIPSRLGQEEFLRVKIGQVDGEFIATPLARGAGSITSLTEADGILRIPPDSEGVSETETALAELLRPRSRLARTLVAVGSHDNSLDILTDELRRTDSPTRLSSSHAGSMGGLAALKRGRCHLAGIHLLDETDGSYNISWIRRFLPDIPVRLIHLVMREQGLMVLPGNPSAISGLKDLARPDIRFVNRQAGSGTRVLLDFRLRELGIPAADIRGYDTDEFTHMAVAAAVAGGRAHCGLGIRAAAKALGLEFIPVVTEQYDLVIPAVYYDREDMGELIRVIRTPGVQDRIRALGGYDTGRTGEEIPLPLLS
ncbi:MAG: molybdopterin biosynthesis protein [Desulfobacterales bacterium]|nr:MAG: molybdopterin biosynthesis protein [Desulfobacterales bacterium]